MDDDGGMFESTIIIYDAHNCHQISYNFQIFNFDCVKSCTIIVVVVVDIDNDPGNHFITNVIWQYLAQWFIAIHLWNWSVQAWLSLTWLQEKVGNSLVILRIVHNVAEYYLEIEFWVLNSKITQRWWLQWQFLGLKENSLKYWIW